MERVGANEVWIRGKTDQEDYRVGKAYTVRYRVGKAFTVRYRLVKTYERTNYLF